ncbi:bifunctional diguanylate cyclase/phosphodiesterase [Microvirga subterranea]|uniref:PAS domain S-box-containing protein/diguanylate cyclase (GGDEF)-like protein n=1 Tax=Microvirga subterranea TaxID=186651 RepID=A0A370HU56_9HYPH|nr:EAL domain-containing protein [Microvirga subterranea]RDI61885.1 PAS domain S-box-containing protein/diguanylate cyclase (GGDEF)-like protein [Microvirga subterranea]
MTHVGTYNPVLVALSLLIATLASYTALDLAGRIRASGGRVKRAWLATAAVAMGGGMWAMHFIAMLALTLPDVKVTYEIGPTILSFLLPIVVTGLSIHLLSRTDAGPVPLVLSGILMGLGMAAMHYTGMAAMEMGVDISYERFWVAVSILIAVGASTTALWLAFRNVGFVQKLLAAPVMGVASAGLHYSAMQGAIFTTQGPVRPDDGHISLSPMVLALAVSVTTLLILFLALISAMFDRRFAQLAKREAMTLRESEERFRNLYNKTPLPLHSLNSQGVIEYVSDAWLELLGYRRAEVEGRPITDFMTADAIKKRETVWSNLFRTGEAKDIEYRLVTKDGRILDVLMSGRVQRDEDGQFSHVFGGVIDVTARNQASEALRASEERLRLALHAGRMFAWEHDLATDFITRSQHSMDLLGIGSGPLSDFLERVHPEDQPLRQRFLHQIYQKGSETAEFRYILPDGKVLWLGSRAEKASPTRVVGVTFDITDRKMAEEEVWRVANHDVLTSLPNRALFQERLAQALADAQQSGTSVSLLLIDLDDFKDVNDTLGHDAGDALLREMALRLAVLAGEHDTVARIGGDEFAVVLVQPRTLEGATAFAETVTARLRQPFAYAGRTVISRASVGVARYPDHDRTPVELMKDADIALYQAKADGRNRVVTYSPSLRTMIEQRVSLGKELRQAILLGQIVPFYQPKVCLASGRVIGLEALARWQHPSRGLLTPGGYFGASFDDPEIAADIGEQLMSAVAADMRQWLDKGLRVGRVAVNLSSAEFGQPRLADRISDVLDRHRIPPENFEVEVTETVLLGRSSDVVAATLRQLHERGILVALDDFGTGYASLTHLKQFPVGHVKIDRSFIVNLEQDAGDEAIVAAIIALGRNLGMRITAEGVETEGQAKRLLALGCDNAQGFLFAEPVPGYRAAELLPLREIHPAL